MPVFVRARVLQTPPCTTITYATASNTQPYLQNLVNVTEHFLHGKFCLYITNFLTKPRLYIPRGLSQITKSFG